MNFHGGILAQLGEHYIHIVGVTGSSPVSPTNEKPSEQLLRGFFCFQCVLFVRILNYNGRWIRLIYFYVCMGYFEILTVIDRDIATTVEIIIGCLLFINSHHKNVEAY
jgi:hypothetical protein